jgi:DNA mismatch endonuclease (patch repair protein)
MKKMGNYAMSCVRSSETPIETKLRKALWNKGYRYRKNYKELKGKPDIVFTKSKVAVFCDGEFWHGFDWENNKKKFKSNKDYWIAKIERNMERDRNIDKHLRNLGWKVLRFWGKEIEKNVDECLRKVEKAVGGIFCEEK